MTHEELEDAVPLYAAGALERAERQALEAHLLSGCVSCHTALKEFQSASSLLPFGLPSATPPRSLKAKILAARSAAPSVEEAQEKQPAKPSLEPGEWMNHLFPPETPASIWSIRWGFAVAALSVVALGLSLAWNSYQAMTQETAQLRASSQERAMEVASLQQTVQTSQHTLEEVRAELERHQQQALELTEQLSAKDLELEELRLQMLTRTPATNMGRMPELELATLLRQQTSPAIVLTGSGKAKQASGFLLPDARARKIWLYTAKLPRCPQGMHYHLWAMEDPPVSIGTFHNHRDETTHQFVMTQARLSPDRPMAVSLEPMEERTVPSGPIYLTSAHLAE